MVQAGGKVTILEKSRGVGGRMATRRMGDGLCDHGAQFFTARDELFAARVREWAEAGLALPWAEQFPDEAARVPPLPVLRYRGAPSMTAIPKSLARHLDVKLGQRALRATVVDRRWEIITDQGLKFTAEALILTSPVPQSLALFDSDHPLLTREMIASLRMIQYRPCVAMLLLLDGPSMIPVPGAVYLSEGPIHWMADNQRKGISPAVTTVTLHASADYSARNFETADAEITTAVLYQVRRWLGSGIREQAIHRWRYSEPVSAWPDPCLVGVTEPPLVFAGDAFGGGRIEGAALSGLAAARTLLSLHQS